MKSILMTGATGFVGNELGQKLVRLGHKIKVVTRNEKKAKQQLAFPAEIIVCDLNRADLPKAAFDDVGCVIHLAGEPIDGRWTEEKKTAILESRVNSSKHLLANLSSEVTTVISASAQGIYGDQGDRELDENGTPGFGFLADVCKEWEKPFNDLSTSSSARVVVLRLGLVISQHGGAIKKMLPLFQKNIGATLGTGTQWVSWIHLEDLCQIFINAISNRNYRGVINAGSDRPVRNSEFTKKMCQHLKVFQAPRVPEFAMMMAFGEMAEILLTSTKMIPKKLKGNDFKFKYPDLDAAFAEEFKDIQSGQSCFTTQQYLPYPIEKVFDFFAEAKNLEEITPKTLNFKIRSMSTEKIQQNTLIQYDLKIHGLRAKWLTKIESWKPPFEFVDTQLKGPYTKWHHIHSFEKMGDGTLISDRIIYKIPMGFLGRLIVGALVQGDIETIFSYRRQIIAEHTF